jgi:hypothetical protein
MHQPQRQRRTAVLWLLVLLALAYALLLRYQHPLTGRSDLDGGVGVVLGLYICAQPAANLLDMILFGRYAPRQPGWQRRDAWWLAQNALVMLAGLAVLMMGTTRFTRGA